ncbi:MAG: hypothetical protein P4L99_04210 [Chthoniobacter sp.]|nr:hypothetical protein [Chthoniobacter sp.]
MNKIHCLAVLLCGMMLTLRAPAAPEGKVSQATSKDVTAAQVNGTWECKLNSLKVWALGKGKLQVAFDGTYEYKSPQGPMANTGQGAGIATIDGDTAIFRPEGADEGCKITLKFTGGKLIVKQEGECGFGNRVYADGTYKKTSGKKPNFDQDR